MSHIPSERLLDIEDALVSPSNPARADGTLDYERCARLHNYLIAYGWMVRHEKGPHELDELLHRPKYLDNAQSSYSPDRLHPDVIAFLNAIIPPRYDEGTCYFVGALEVRSADEVFISDDNRFEDIDRFVIIYRTYFELGSQCLGLVYDQEYHRAAVPLFIGSSESIEPIADHENLWMPLETILSNWIHMVNIGKVTTDSASDEDLEEMSQNGMWRWQSYSPAQVDTAVAAMNRLSASIEAKMSPESLSLAHRDNPLLTDEELDAALIPKRCFIRSFLTRVRTPGFKFIAPGLEVPHDAAAFSARQKFTGLPRSPDDTSEDQYIPAVLIFASADSARTLPFNDELKSLFFRCDDPVPYREGDPIPVGLYSEPVDRTWGDIAEEGFRLVLPFHQQPGTGSNDGARHSDGSLIGRQTFTQLFQHGNYYPFGGEHRAQRLERLLDRWRELVENGQWTVGREGVEGVIDTFKDADRGAWRDYWIPPDW
ncbi:hypothetical protein EYB25_000233 [Talaromyces marneffei]|uniref:Uncharacterized protein n=1 Tax=Talaromyces marneffei (strain ATCC 18224 / CBS 334.59 / QM 7333) TaxID=441960 RepID=B6Q8A3_TALMQ|nr:uncharacterized protein EYB26_002120 [Talaromyces marneffei]EEA28855.1 conserved hypothetical protein [Talaromyces marneffei ATCC 18224]KAE8555536.1 hypothetical protein EYB25_000233 [Talaromyces marneffei]QGA14466.1 hypothetical protein EYB26_002120 [Talaromyces marneffei]